MRALRISMRSHDGREAQAAITDFKLSELRDPEEIIIHQLRQCVGILKPTCTRMANTTNPIRRINPRNPFNRLTVNLQSSIQLIEERTEVGYNGREEHTLVYRAPRAGMAELDRVFKAGQPLQVGDKHFVVMRSSYTYNSNDFAQVTIEVRAVDFAAVAETARAVLETPSVRPSDFDTTRNQRPSVPVRLPGDSSITYHGNIAPKPIIKQHEVPSKPTPAVNRPGFRKLLK